MKRLELRQKTGKFLADEHALAVITPSRDGRDGGGSGGTIFDDSSAGFGWEVYKRETANPLPVVVMAIENYGRVYRLLKAQRAGHDRDERRHQVHRRSRARLRHHRRNSRHRSQAEGRSRDGRRPSGFLGLRDRRNRQRRRHGRRHGSDAHSQHASGEAAPHHPRCACGPARRKASSARTVT